MKIILQFFILSLPFLSFGQTIVYADEEYGFNSNDAQSNFYDAIKGEKGTGNTLIFRDMGSPWYLTDTDRLFDVDNLTIIFEPGCIIEAKQGEWASNEKLINILRATNLKIIGYGASFKMYKSDFTTGEFGHSINIISANDLEIKGLTLDGSGGDGIYIRDWNNALVEDVKAINHKRQGVSVISCNNVLIRHSLFKDTSGIAPQDGIDIEPNNNTQNVVGLIVENCSFINNASTGMGLAVGKTDASSADISVTFDNCYVSENNINASYLPSELRASASGNGNNGSTMNGLVTFKNIACDGSPTRMFYSRKQADAYKVVFDNVVGLNMVQTNSTPPILLETTPSSYTGPASIGNIDFNDVLVKFDSDDSFLRIQGANATIMPSLKDVGGNITVIQPTATDIEYRIYDASRNDNVTLTYNNQSTLPTTTVNISTTVAEASKSGQIGIATITRNSSRLDYPLFVKYSVSSPLVEQGNDIHILTGAVIIKAGETSAEVIIEARDNGESENSRPVILTLENRDLYVIGNSAAAQIDVVDMENSGSNNDFFKINETPRTISSYSSQDNGGFEIQDSNSTIKLTGNSWKKAQLDYNITPNTILEFEVKVTGLGEVNGIGFDNNNDFTGSEDNSTTFALAGTQQDTGIQDFSTYTGNGWVSFSIPVGSYFTGNYAYLTFLADKDSNPSSQESFLRNITISETSDGVKINGNPRDVTSYSSQDSGEFEIQDSNSTIKLTGNSWKKAQLDYNITPNTILDFEVKVTGLGEVNGIGFDNNNDFTGSEDNSTTFALAGTQQDTGIQDFSTYTGNGWVSFSIPVGSYFTGNYEYLTFLADKDSNPSSQESFLRNINLSEQADPVTVALSPTHDAYLQGSTRYNTSLLRVSPNSRVAYLKYDLSGINGEITEAQLKFTVAVDEGNGPIEIYQGSNTNWTENNLSSSNKPSEVNLLSGLSDAYEVGNFTILLSPTTIDGGGELSLVIKQTGGDDFAFSSKERNNGANFPELSLTYTPTLGNITNLNAKLEPESDNQMSLFPNPVTNHFTISGIKDKTNIKIIDINGRLIQEKITTDSNIDFDFYKYPKGIYFIRLYSKEEKNTLKIIKK